MRRWVAVLCTLSFLLFGQGTVTASDAVISVPNTENKIALTFDDGPHPVYTQEILDILDDYGIKATFFVIGENAQRYPDLIWQELAAGHEIGNHTFSHPHMKAMSEESLNAELKQTEQLLDKMFDCKPKLFRPPEGFCCSAVTSSAKRFGYQITLWDVDTTDWAHNSTANIVKTVVTGTKSGDIILCHDFVTKPSPTPDALRAFIPKLQAKGFEFVTVSELLAAEKL